MDDNKLQFNSKKKKIDKGKYFSIHFCAQFLQNEH